MARYELFERIGIGGMAEIFRGKAIAAGGFEKPVAIKRILPEFSQDRRFVELLITEAKTLSQLRHRNIVQIYDVGFGDDGQYFLVMEFVDGADLGALYELMERRSRMPPVEVSLYIGAEVCEALEHAHRAKRSDGVPLRIVHRDVSPSNVLLSRSGEVKLTDFGIAKRMEEATGHGSVRGKFAYISPEQAANEHVDARSDVFSCGIVLYELIVGHRLFSRMPDLKALQAVRENSIPRPRDLKRDLAPELESILLKALASNPDDRFESAAAFGATLRNYRYSIDSAMADPSRDVADLVAHWVDGPQPFRGNGEGTFVRISTAAGFPGEFAEEREETLVAGSDRGEFFGSARNMTDTFDDAETRAVGMGSLSAAVRDDDEAETRLLQRPAELDQFQRGETITGTFGGPAEVAPTAIFGGTRPPPPRLREIFHDSVPGPPRGRAVPAISAVPGPLAIPPTTPVPASSANHRRAILILAGLAAVLAVSAFAITAAFLGTESDPDGEEEAMQGAGTTVVPTDATVPTPDAGVQLTGGTRRSPASGDDAQPRPRKKLEKKKSPRPQKKQAGDRSKRNRKRR
jgi:hypothetical protein